MVSNAAQLILKEMKEKQYDLRRLYDIRLRQPGLLLDPVIGLRCLQSVLEHLFKKTEMIVQADSSAYLSAVFYGEQGGAAYFKRDEGKAV